MHVAKLSDIKNDLSGIIERVRRGERVRVLVRGVPAADIVPVEQCDGEHVEDVFSEELALLERRGVIRRGTGDVVKEILKPGPKVSARKVSRALADERDERK